MKQKRAAAFLLAALFVFLSLTGCSSASSFTVLAASIPENLDPQLASSAAEKTAVVNLFQGLYRRDTNGEATLAAAESVQISEDGLIYTFAIRQGQYWDTYRKNGEQVTPQVTADDFLFAFERIFDKHTGSPWASEFSNIDTIETPSDTVLIIRLLRADDSFPLKLTGAGAMPCNREFFEYAAGAYGLSYAYLLTNGPFSIYAWQAGERLVLARDNDIRGWVNKITFAAPEEDDTRGFADRFAAGEGSGAMTSAGDEAGNAYSLTTWAILFNCTNSFLAREDVRGALASAALGAELELAAHPQLQAASGLVPPGVSVSEGSYRETAGTPYTLLANPGTVMRDAVNHWAQSAGAEGFATVPTLTVLLPDSGPYAELFDEVNERWQRQLSCFFAVQQVGLEELEAAVKVGGYDIAFAPLYAESDSAADMLAAFPAAYGTGWQSSEYNALTAAAQMQTEASEALRLSMQAEALMLAQWPAVPLLYETNHFATDKAYSGLSVYPFGPVLDFSAPAGMISADSTVDPTSAE